MISRDALMPLTFTTILSLATVGAVALIPSVASAATTDKVPSSASFELSDGTSAEIVIDGEMILETTLPEEGDGLFATEVAGNPALAHVPLRAGVENDNPGMAYVASDTFGHHARLAGFPRQSNRVHSPPR